MHVDIVSADVMLWSNVAASDLSADFEIAAV